MTGTCLLCSQLIVIPDDQLLDDGRDDRAFQRMAQAIGAHVQQHHPQQAQPLIQFFIAFQLVMWSFFLADPNVTENSVWLRGRTKAHQRLRAMLNEERPISVNRVQPGAQRPDKPAVMN